MKKSYKSLVILSLIFLLGYSACHSDPMNHRITRKNEKAFHKSVVANDIDKDTFINVFESEIKGVRNLSDEDELLLITYIIRHLLDEDGETTFPLVGKTVKEIIDLEKELERKENEEKAKLTLLENSVILTVEKKELVPWEEWYGPSKVPPLEYVLRFYITYKNISEEDIRAFKGNLSIEDIFEEHIKTIPIEVMEAIKPGHAASIEIDMKIHFVEPFYERLKTLDLKNLVITWRPTKIVLANGTVISRE